MKMSENRRNEQVLRNEIVSIAWSIAKVELALGDFISIKRLRASQAYVFETENYFFLKSHNTFVAFINKTTDTCYDILRKVCGYTTTSAQHIVKFCDDYGQQNRACHQSYMYKRVW